MGAADWGMEKANPGHGKVQESGRQGNFSIRGTLWLEGEVRPKVCRLDN